MSLFETIRKSTNALNAQAVRGISGEDLRVAALNASKAGIKDKGREVIDSFVDEYLRQSATLGLAEVLFRFPELEGDSDSAKEARAAIIESVVLSGQYFKKTVWESIKGILDNVHARSAETISAVLIEVYVETFAKKTSKALPLPKD